MRSTREALQWAANQVEHPTRDWTNDCAVFARETFDVPSLGYPSAAVVYKHTKFRHRLGTPPAGTLVFWLGGSAGNGHVAPSAGGGWVYSNDFKREGKIDKVRIADITAGWHQDYKGWTEDINGVRVWTKPEPHLLYSAVARAAAKHTSLYYGRVLKTALAAEVGWGLMLPNKVLGAGFRRRWARLQAHIHGGQPSHYSGQPSHEDLTWLGKRHGFQVV